MAFADAVIVPVDCGVTKITLLPSWFVIPLPEAEPLRVILAPFTAEPPADTVNVI